MTSMALSDLFTASSTMVCSLFNILLNGRMTGLNARSAMADKTKVSLPTNFSSSS
eukprot:g7446.t1